MPEGFFITTGPARAPPRRGFCGAVSNGFAKLAYDRDDSPGPILAHKDWMWICYTGVPPGSPRAALISDPLRTTTNLPQGVKICHTTTLSSVSVTGAPSRY